MAAIDTQFTAWLKQQQDNWAIEGIGELDTATQQTLQKYWDSLDASAKATFFQRLQSNSASSTQVAQIVQALPAPTAAPTAPDPNSAAGVQSQATTAATAATAQLPEQTTGNVAPGIPVVGSSGADVPGTTTPADFNNLLQNYYQSAFAQAGGDPTQLAQLAGLTPQNLQTQYQAYTAGLQKAFANVPQGAGAYTPLSLQQFAQNKAQTMMGPWSAVLDAISAIYQSQYQQPLPPDLATQIITALNGMPQSQQSNVLYNAYQYMTNKASAQANKGLFDQTGTYAASILNALPSSILTYTAGTGTSTGALGTSGLVGTYAQVHPSAFLQGETIQQGIAAAFQKALNRAPTAADVKALGANPTPAQIQTYIDNQPMPGYNMTYGAYQSASSQLTPLWQEYFGHDPTAQQLKWAVGKSPEDVTSFINNSESSIPGMTIGVKNDYESFISQLDKGTGTGHGLSMQIDEGTMSDLYKQVQGASTGKAAPGPMP